LDAIQAEKDKAKEDAEKAEKEKQEAIEAEKAKAQKIEDDRLAAEQAEKDRLAEEERQKALAPDKEKLRAWANRILEVESPKLQEQNQNLVTNYRLQIEEVVFNLKAHINKL